MDHNYLDELNEVQRSAVTHINGPVLVIAGPGSGKTRVLTYRIAHLIKSGIAPWEILALTFTNKAAKEMKERIAVVVGDKANMVWAGTFHSIFARILRYEAEKIGYPSNFTIYDTQDSKSLLTEIIKGQGLDTKVYNTGAVLGRISLAKNNLITPEQYKGDAQRLMEDRQNKRPYIYKLYSLYVNRCKKAGAMDFDDLLYNMYQLMRQNTDNVADKYRKKFPYVMVDEFQDTNQLQSAIVQELVNYPGSPKNICVVGDDAQSIYAFRGATIQNILDLERDFPTLTTYKLEQNYRSTQFIVEAANDVIAKNSRQIKKTIFTDKTDGHPIQTIRTVTDAEEAKRVANTILEQKNRYHLDNKEFAILYRTNSQSRVFEESLTRLRIPYKVYGGLSFYQRKEIKDFISYLRLAINPADEEATRRVINYPKRGIGKTSIDKISAIAVQENRSIWEVLQDLKKYGFNTRTQTSVKSFLAIVTEISKRVNEMNAYDLAMYTARQTEMLKVLKLDNSVEGISRFENLTELLDGIQAFVEDQSLVDEDGNEVTKDIATYMQNIALLTDQDTEKGEEDNRIKLMSVHSAKGLEFDSVFVVGLEENLFPSFMSLQSNDPRSAIDEERRLFYVAITRARKFLTLTYSGSRLKFGQVRYNAPSRFINEISSITINSTTMSSKVKNDKVLQQNVSGFSRLKKSGEVQASKWLGNFEPSPLEDIKIGVRVTHLRFGEGLVSNIEGAVGNEVGTIVFDDEEIGEKRIMLKHAKLRVKRPRKNKLYTEED